VVPIDEPDAVIPRAGSRTGRGDAPAGLDGTLRAQGYDHRDLLSQVGRRLLRAPLSLTIEVCRNLVADVGLDLSDIDEITTWPGAMNGAGGFTEGGTTAPGEALRTRPTWHCGGIEMAA
jgi:hypothetical protein